jgi:hypothetical protein
MLNEAGPHGPLESPQPLNAAAHIETQRITVSSDRRELCRKVTMLPRSSKLQRRPHRLVTANTKKDFLQKAAELISSQLRRSTKPCSKVSDTHPVIDAKNFEIKFSQGPHS